MDTLELLRELAIIIIFAKLFGLLARKLKAPQVAGEIVAGLLIGPSVLNWVQDSDFIEGMAEIGVILLMFNAGLETNLHDLKKTGIKATLIAAGGVIVPLILGTILYMAFYGFASFGTEEFDEAVMIGCIMTATSVSEREYRFGRHQNVSLLRLCNRCRIPDLPVFPDRRQEAPPYEKNSDHEPCSLLCDGLHRGEILRCCRYHGRLLRRYHPLLSG